MIGSEQDKCGRCDYPLLPNAFIPCTFCEMVSLCPRCAMEEVPLCRDCLTTQVDQAIEVEKKRMLAKPCALCNGIYETSLCIQCDSYTCSICDKNPNIHKCPRCLNTRCMKKQTHECCAWKYCDSCYESHCEIVKKFHYFTCKWCFSKVITDSDISRYYQCPVPNCPRQWGCQTCNVRRPSGLYCQDHISGSRVKCELCSLAYPLVLDRPGTLFVGRRGGNRKAVAQCCDICLAKMRALVEGILILGRRRGQRLEPAIMDEIVLMAIRTFGRSLLLMTPIFYDD